MKITRNQLVALISRELIREAVYKVTDADGNVTYTDANVAPPGGTVEKMGSEGGTTKKTTRVKDTEREKREEAEREERYEKHVKAQVEKGWEKSRKTVAARKAKEKALADRKRARREKAGEDKWWNLLDWGVTGVQFFADFIPGPGTALSAALVVPQVKLAIRNKNWLGAGLSIVSLFPVIGDTVAIFGKTVARGGTLAPGIAGKLAQGLYNVGDDKIQGWITSIIGKDTESGKEIVGALKKFAGEIKLAAGLAESVSMKITRGQLRVLINEEIRYLAETQMSSENPITNQAFEPPTSTPRAYVTGQVTSRDVEPSLDNPSSTIKNSDQASKIFAKLHSISPDDYDIICNKQPGGWGCEARKSTLGAESVWSGEEGPPGLEST